MLPVFCLSPCRVGFGPLPQPPVLFLLVRLVALARLNVLPVSLISGGIESEFGPLFVVVIELGCPAPELIAVEVISISSSGPAGVDVSAATGGGITPTWSLSMTNVNQYHGTIDDHGCSNAMGIHHTHAVPKAMKSKSQDIRLIR